MNKTASVGGLLKSNQLELLQTNKSTLQAELSTLQQKLQKVKSQANEYKQLYQKLSKKLMGIDSQRPPIEGRGKGIDYLRVPQYTHPLKRHDKQNSSSKSNFQRCSSKSDLRVFSASKPQQKSSSSITPNQKTKELQTLLQIRKNKQTH